MIMNLSHRNDFAVINSIDLDTWDFDAFAYDDIELLPLLMLTEMNSLERFNIPEELCKNFISNIRQNYFDNPYHNFNHAVDVMQVWSSLATG